MTSSPKPTPPEPSERAREIAEQITSDIYDRPSIETREEFTVALTDALEQIAGKVRQAEAEGYPDAQPSEEWPAWCARQFQPVIQHAIDAATSALHGEVLRLRSSNMKLQGRLARLGDDLDMHSAALTAAKVEGRLDGLEWMAGQMRNTWAEDALRREIRKLRAEIARLKGGDGAQ